jgi:ribose/xylose/arabinose/galactoside ABC-type transport system permease subunit
VTATEVAEYAQSGPSRLTRLRRFHFRELTLLPVIALAIVVGIFVSDAFLTKTNFINLFQQSSELAIVVIAETLILLAGKFDLSLESIVGLAPMVGAWLIVTNEAVGGSGIGLNGYVAILVMLAVGVAVGVVNGFLVVKLALNAFIVTLAMLILLRGVTLGITSGKTLTSLPDEVLYLGNATWFTIPVSIWLAGFLYVVFGLLLRYHTFGRAIYAVGGNAQAARAAGIRVERVTWLVFIIGGLLAAVAGLMLTGRIASATAAQGTNMIFTVFAAAVIGGISLNGGRGRLVGALSGVILLAILSNILTLSNIATFWIDASFGAIILIALVLSSVSGQRLVARVRGWRRGTGGTPREGEAAETREQTLQPTNKP